MAYLHDLADTWNDSGTTFTALKMNVTDTASNAASLLMDLQVGGSSKFSVTKGGFLTISERSASGQVAIGSSANNGVAVSSSWVGLSVGGTGGLRVNAGTVWLSKPLGWTSGATHDASSADLYLYRDAANTLALRNSTNAQAFNVYNTYTDASNYERCSMRWNANAFELYMQGAGTGSGRHLKITSSVGSGYLQVIGANTPTLEIIQSTGTKMLFSPLYQELQEVTAPSSPSTNFVRIYAEDNGSGKTRLMALFATGAAQQIAIEP